LLLTIKYKAYDARRTTQDAGQRTHGTGLTTQGMRVRN